MADIQARQIWADPSPTDEPRCTAYHLPSTGFLVLNGTTTISLGPDAVYQPECTAIQTSAGNATLPVLELGEPFEASTVPQIFVLGCMLVIAWSLLIILLITPRTSFIVGGSGGGFLGSSGIRNNDSSATAVIGIGGRPWLQKFAAATVGISLLIAAINSFKIIQEQYDEGFEDAEVVTSQVVGSLELRIMRVFSTTFLWLAQVQTLIRLFPRHREKIIIKWSGFGLILLDTLFAVINNFVSGGGAGPRTDRPRRFTEAVPALSYLFELALSLLYAAWVVYYALAKRRFAFFHPKMHNICLVALLSIVSISIPVVFFVMDIAKPDLSGWGDYIRWVGAAAASVVVWEWVERIEALEREERKDGILGREIFDGDEMLEATPSVEVRWPWPRTQKGAGSWPSSSGGGDLGMRGDSTPRGSSQNVIAIEGSTRRPKAAMRGRIGDNADAEAPNLLGRPVERQQRPSPPQPIVSPVSRSDTNSASSTVYAVVHHPVSPFPAPVQESRSAPASSGIQFAPPAASRSRAPFGNFNLHRGPAPAALRDGAQNIGARLQSVPNPFKKRRRSPPPEVSQSAVDATGAPSAARWTKTRSPKNLFRLRRQQQLPPSELPLVVVPAQRGRIWSPPPLEGESNGHIEEAYTSSATPARHPLASPNLAENRARNSDRSPDEPSEQQNNTSEQPLSTSPNPVGSPTTEDLQAPPMAESSAALVAPDIPQPPAQEGSKPSSLPTVEEQSTAVNEPNNASPRLSFENDGNVNQRPEEG